MKKCILFSLILMLTCSLPALAEYPEKNIEVIAPASPGGGWDMTARAVQKVIKDNDLAPQSLVVVNKPGGGGAVGWTYLKTKAGDPYYLAMDSSLILLNQLLGRSELSYKDFTPIATMTTEWCAIVVKADSPFNDGAELMKALSEDPEALSVGVAPSLGNDDHLSFVLAAKKYGVEIKKLRMVVYESGGDLLPALLGGHVDVLTCSVSEASEFAKAGDAKMLAVSSDQRLTGDLAEVPTWKELGVDMEFPHWRGIVGPPEMPAEAIAWWDETLTKMVQTENWKQVLTNNEWEDYYKNSEQTAALLEEQYQVYKELVELLGLAQ